MFTKIIQWYFLNTLQGFFQKKSNVGKNSFLKRGFLTKKSFCMQKDFTKKAKIFLYIKRFFKLESSERLEYEVAYQVYLTST